MEGSIINSFSSVTYTFIPGKDKFHQGKEKKKLSRSSIIQINLSNSHFSKDLFKNSNNNNNKRGQAYNSGYIKTIKI